MQSEGGRKREKSPQSNGFHHPSSSAASAMRPMRHAFERQQCSGAAILRYACISGGVLFTPTHCSIFGTESVVPHTVASLRA